MTNPETQKLKLKKPMLLSTCAHYKSFCDIKAPCCKRFYSCRLCHDQRTRHIVDRFSIKQIRCRKCLFVQEPSIKCVNCDVQFSEYFCNLCNLWSTNIYSNNKSDVNNNSWDKKTVSSTNYKTPSLISNIRGNDKMTSRPRINNINYETGDAINELSDTIFHCKECGVCKVGSATTTFHCSICNTCMPNILKDNHKCIENIMCSNCIICSEGMLNTTEAISMLPCGHTMHEKCLIVFSSICYLCPVCKKSMGNFDQVHDIIGTVLKICNNKEPKPIDINREYNNGQGNMAIVDKVKNRSTAPLSADKSSSAGFDIKKKIGNIKCLDCSAPTTLILDKVFNRCGACKSYNTTLLIDK
ncbi:RING finger and CHY zinc finger domain-containing protein 1 [Cucumispora dikerogammari]|nr:RING finger and CHY zinc finger domain-containing protein 1 [Cucumispora dikerogammari]